MDVAASNGSTNTVLFWQNQGGGNFAKRPVTFEATAVFQVDKTSVNLPATWERPTEIAKGSAFVVLAKIQSGAGGEELVYKFSAGKESA